MRTRKSRKHATRALWLAVSLWAAWGAAAQPVRFCITADNRGKEGFANVLQQIKRLPDGPGAFMISVGDVSPPQTTRKQLDRALGPSFRWYFVIGNHEVARKDPKRGPEALQYLRECFDKHIRGGANPGPPGAERTTYSFDAGEVHIAVLNEYWDGSTGPDGESRLDGNVVAPLRAWLQKDLQASAKPWKLVIGHEPAYPQEDSDWTGTRHAGSSLNRHKANRDAFWKLLEDQGVAAYVCGHTHRYSRYRPKGSKVWQIDAAQATGSSTSWKYDAFLIVSVDRERLKFDVYRNLNAKGRFELADSLSLDSPKPGKPTEGSGRAGTSATRPAGAAG